MLLLSRYYTPSYITLTILRIRSNTHASRPSISRCPKHGSPNGKTDFLSAGGITSRTATRRSRQVQLGNLEGSRRGCRQTNTPTYPIFHTLTKESKTLQPERVASHDSLHSQYMRHRRAGLVAAVLLLWAGVGAVARPFSARESAPIPSLSPSPFPSAIVSAQATYNQARNFGDVLGGIETSPAKTTATTAHGAEPASATTKLEPPHGGNVNPLLGPTGTSPLNGLLPLTGTATAKTSAATTAIGITPAAAVPGQGGAHSIIGTPPPTLAKPTYIRPTNHPNPVTETDSHTILVAATATANNGNNGGASSMPSAPSKSSGPSSQEWRIIGVAVSAVSVVGAGILAVVFFDQWWRFLTACCCAGRRQRREVIPSER